MDYHFISDKDFRAKIEGDEFLEWATVHDHLYGTGRAETESVLARGADLVLDVDVQGAAQVKRATPGAVLIFVLPPSFAILEQRLRDRRQNKPADIEQRLEEARHEVSQHEHYDYTVVNDELDHGVEVLQSIVLAERAKRHRMEPAIGPILDSFK